MPNTKICKSFEEFTEIIDEAKSSGLIIFINGIKITKRKNLIEDFEDIFDNNFMVEYHFLKDVLEIFVRTNKINTVVINDIEYPNPKIWKPRMELRYKLKEITAPKEHFIETNKEWILQQLWISNSDETEWRDVEKVL